MATLLRFIPYVEQFSFRRVLASAWCSLASLPFQYEEASLSHGALQASNRSLARRMSVHKRICTRQKWHYVFHIKERKVGICKRSVQGRCPLDQQVKRTFLTATPFSNFWKQHDCSVYSSDMLIKINRRNSGFRRSPVTWNILKSSFISAVCQSFSLCVLVLCFLLVFFFSR